MAELGAGDFLRGKVALVDRLVAEDMQALCVALELRGEFAIAIAAEHWQGEAEWQGKRACGVEGEWRMTMVRLHQGQ
eukprot:2849583-Alexandrium_andersonii.AAC.1